VCRYRAAAPALFVAALLLGACARSGSSSAQASAAPELSSNASPAITSPANASPAASAGTPVAYSDISGTFGEQYITDLAALGIFGTPSGSFNPAGTITRGDFVKWLVLANNALYANLPEKQIRLSQSPTSSYADVPKTHPDFPYIQGVYDAGFAVGFPDKTFRPDALLTREQMIAIKESVDRGGVQQYYVANWEPDTPNWKDKRQIDRLFRGAIAEDAGLDRAAVFSWSHPNLVVDNVPRTFGAIAMFRPQEPVTRAQAALVLWKIGAHTDQVANPTPNDVPRAAADALAPPTPTPTP
jgi:hypothetical protein